MNIETFLQKEKDNASLWYSAVYLISILMYFWLEEEPSLLHVFILASISFVIAIIVNLKTKLLTPKFVINIILAFSLGFLNSTLNTYNTTPIAIKSRIYDRNVEGEVVKIKPTPFGTQISLEKPIIEGLPPEETPEIVRISVSKFSSNHVLIGDKISLKADLSPPSAQIVPDGYDFKLVAFFNKIGAVGKAVSEPEIAEYIDKGMFTKILNLRKDIYSILIKNLGSKNGNFAAALFLGEIGGIDKTTLNNMRYAGISHILCVSGLHLSLVAAIFFITSRVLLNLSTSIALRYDIKKLAGYISLLASFFYLLLTGMQIAATRAFIMTSVAIYSILIARQPYPMRSLSLACVIILTMNPEYAIHPSFQLSFIAVISLLVGYEFYSKAKNLLGNSKGVFANLKLYLFSNIYSSIVASFATAPIVIYHFYVYSNYSIIANLVAVPMVSFVSMPVGILALGTSYFGFSSYLFYILSKSIDIIRETASFTVSLPASVIYCGSMYNSSIILFIFSFFWFSIWKSAIRHLGLAGITLSMVLFAFEKHPDILINGESTFVAQKTPNEAIIYGAKISPFTKNFVANWMGFEKPEIKKIDLKKNILSVNFKNNPSCRLLIDYENMEFSLNGLIYPIEDLVTIYSSNGVVEYHKSNRFMFR